jgi:hypothetical protein
MVQGGKNASSWLLLWPGREVQSERLVAWKPVGPFAMHGMTRMGGAGLLGITRKMTRGVIRLTGWSMSLP